MTTCEHQLPAHSSLSVSLVLFKIVTVYQFKSFNSLPCLTSIISDIILAKQHTNSLDINIFILSISFFSLIFKIVLLICCKNDSLILIYSVT